MCPCSQSTRDIPAAPSLPIHTATLPVFVYKTSQWLALALGPAPQVSRTSTVRIVRRHGERSQKNDQKKQLH